MKQLIILMLISANCLAQLTPPSKTPVAKYNSNPIPEFMGIEVDGTRSQIINQFTQKGFKVNQKTENAITFKGEINGREIELITLYTVKSGKCWKFAVYLPKKISWYSLKQEYEEYVEILKNKYGTPTNNFATFISPYYEGDGYELTAVQIEKCIYSCFWGTKIYIEISKYNQVSIKYENETNSDLNEKEKSETNKQIF